MGEYSFRLEVGGTYKDITGQSVTIVKDIGNGLFVGVKRDGVGLFNSITIYKEDGEAEEGEYDLVEPVID